MMRSWRLAVLLGAVLTLFCPAPVRAQAPGEGRPPSYQAALAAYLKGRQLESAAKDGEAANAFSSSLAMTERLLQASPSSQDLVVLKCWNLFRLGRHTEVVSAALSSPFISREYRLMETMAESLYFLERTEESLRYFSKYVELAPPQDDRMSSAYYYMGECYLRLKKYEHADIAFVTATAMEKGLYFWWFRLGWVKEILGQYRKAHEAYGKSLSLNPGFVNAKDGQARVRAKAGL